MSNLHDSPHVPPPPWRRYAFLGVGVALLAALVWHFGWASLRAAILEADPGLLLAMGLLIVAGFWTRALKWAYALPGTKGVFTLFFLAKVGGNWTPGRVGELAPLLLREHRNAPMLAWLLADRVIEVACTLWLGALGLHALGLLGLPLALVLLFGGPIIAGAGVILLRRVRFPVHPELTLRGRLYGALQRLRGALLPMGSRLPVILLLTGLAKATDIYAVMLLCRAFGYEASFLLVAAARCAHALVAAIPATPDATGVPFVAAAWLLHEYAGMPFPVLTAALTLELLLINAVLHLSFLLSSWRWKVDNSPLPGV